MHRGVFAAVVLCFIATLPASAASYALLFSGGIMHLYNEPRYYWDTMRIYNLLLDDYGYHPDNIVVLFADGLSPDEDQLRRDSAGDLYVVNSDPDLTGDGLPNFSGEGTREALEAALGDLGGRMGPGDTFLMWATGHGGRHETEDTYMGSLAGWGSGNRIYDWELAQWTAGFNVDLETYVFGFCYSGQFIGPMSQPGRIMMTAADAHEMSWGNWGEPSDPADDYNEFHHRWYEALLGAGDADGDGYVTLWESFVYARDNNKFFQSGQEHPQWDDPSGMGEHYTLTGAIPEPAVALLFVAGLLGILARRRAQRLTGGECRHDEAA